jgi:hypothetical protein
MGDNVSECEWCEVVGLRDGSEYCDACSARMCEECLSTHVSYCPDCPPECDCNTKGFTPKEEDDTGRVERDSDDDKSCANCTCAHACVKRAVWLCPKCVENKYDDEEVLDAALGLLRMTRGDVEKTMRPRSPTRRCAKKPRIDDDLDRMAAAAGAAFPSTSAPSPTVDEFRRRLRDATRQCLWCDTKEKPLILCCACETTRCGGVMCTEAHVHYCAHNDGEDSDAPSPVKEEEHQRPMFTPTPRSSIDDKHRRVTHAFPATDVFYNFTPQLMYRQRIDFRPLAKPDTQ